MRPLFLGMWMLTEELKIAGGLSVGNWLGHLSSNRRRGLMTGMMQSSCVVMSEAFGLALAGLGCLFMAMESPEINLGLLTDHRKTGKTQPLTAAIRRTSNIDYVDQALQAATPVYMHENANPG